VNTLVETEPITLSNISLQPISMKKMEMANSLIDTNVPKLNYADILLLEIAKKANPEFCIETLKPNLILEESFLINIEKRKKIENGIGTENKFLSDITFEICSIPEKSINDFGVETIKEVLEYSTFNLIDIPQIEKSDFGAMTDFPEENILSLNDVNEEIKDDRVASPNNTQNDILNLSQKQFISNPYELHDPIPVNLHEKPCCNYIKWIIIMIGILSIIALLFAMFIEIERLAARDLKYEKWILDKLDNQTNNQTNINNSIFQNNLLNTTEKKNIYYRIDNLEQNITDVQYQQNLSEIVNRNLLQRIVDIENENLGKRTDDLEILTAKQNMTLNKTIDSLGNLENTVHENQIQVNSSIDALENEDLEIEKSLNETNNKTDLLEQRIRKLENFVSANFVGNLDQLSFYASADDAAYFYLNNVRVELGNIKAGLQKGKLNILRVDGYDIYGENWNCYFRITSGESTIFEDYIGNTRVTDAGNIVRKLYIRIYVSEEGKVFIY